MTGRWPWSRTYLDVRPTASADQVSLDLCRHVQYRLGTGGIMVIARNPRIFLSVICRRWKSLLREVATQRSYTINSQQRQVLAQELERLNSFYFSSKPVDTAADLLVVTPEQAPTISFECATLYITTTLTDDFMAIAARLRAGGLVVVYGGVTGHD